MNEPTTTSETRARGDDPEPQRVQAAVDETSALARHNDPSLTGTGAKTAPQDAARRRTSVEWVRPTELLASRSARIAGRGIDFHAELARRARRVPGQAARTTGRRLRTTSAAMSERARRLPPASAFGHGGGERFSWVSRSGIGLG